MKVSFCFLFVLYLNYNDIVDFFVFRDYFLCKAWLMPQEILLGSNAHNQHWELSMATNLETVLMKIRPPHLGLIVMHVILGNGF